MLDLHQRHFGDDLFKAEKELTQEELLQEQIRHLQQRLKQSRRVTFFV